MKNDIRYSKKLADFLQEDKSKYPPTLFEILEESVEKYGDRPAVSYAFETPINYKEFRARVLSISELLLERRIAKGDRVAILGENCPNWSICYFAIVRIGAIAVPILPDFPESDIRHILSDSGSSILFATQKQLEKLNELDRTRLSYIIMMDDFDEETHSEIKLESLNAAFERAVHFLKQIPKTITRKSDTVSEDDTASIIYTSGTSGHSKGVMLSHKNFISNMVALAMRFDLEAEDVFLSILPLSHSYEFTLGLMMPIKAGSRIVYLSKAPTPRVLEEVCKTEKPTAICTVPLILEKIYKKKVLTVLEKNTAVKLMTKIPFLKKKIFGKIKEKLIAFFGGRLRIMTIGGAPFNNEAEKFFRASRFPYLVGYGLTETAPLLSGGPFGDPTIKIASSGKICPGCDIKIQNPDPKTGIGEIFARGPNVMKGYYKNPDLSAEVLDGEGWFKTGDLGHFDKYDNLYIKGRSKNMILMANGENIYPEAVEEKLNSCFHVMESLVVENNNHLEAWVYLDYDLIDTETKGKTEGRRLEYIQRILARVKDEVNQQLSAFSKLSRLIEQSEPFVKTATHKIKRYLYTHPEGKAVSRE
ncbi:MAG: long-chain fatty acid--CoA ligase [bacterium]|nr:long-chain fatty acid--CoA ligase [bacterium]